MRNKKILLGGLLLLGIGFAAVSTTLYLTGNVKIATNDEDFNVIFTKAVIDGTDTPSAIIEGGKKITFGTKDLVTVGDKSILDFEVTNNSEMYDAEVSIECSATGAKSDYYQITKEVASPIVAKTTESGKVEVALLKAPTEDIHEEFTCTLTAKAKERTSKAEIPQIYYAFGDPLTATDRTTDYTTLKYTGTETPAKVFVKLDADGIQKSVCIVRNGSLECFRGGTTAYVVEEQAHVQEVFSDGTCSSDGSNVACDASGFRCGVASDGGVGCLDYATRFGCDVYGDGRVDCC